MTSHRADTPEEMFALGATTATHAQPGDFFALVGTLRTGKTHWSKGFITSIDPTATPTSPTFPIVNEHRGGTIPIFHFDLYRLKSPAEITALGWDEYLDENAIIICEWADLFPELIPPTATWLEITHLSPTARTLRHIPRPQVT